MRVVYIDTLFFINLIVNYLLILAVCKICALQVKRLRLIFGAFIGAAYAVVTVLPDFLFMQNVFIKLGFGVLMLLSAFGSQKGLLRISLVFLAVAAAFGGIVMAVALLGGEIWTGGGVYFPISLRALLLSFGLSYGFLTLVFKFMVPGRGKGGYVSMEICHNNKTISLTALKDTGNSVRDPITGMPVPIVEMDIISVLFDKDVNGILKDPQDKTAAERLEELWEYDRRQRFRLISYSAVGIKSGMLLAFKPDIIALNGIEMKGMWLAISPTKVSANGVYSALVNGDI